MKFFKTKIGIILTCAFLIAVITTTGVFAAQTISKKISGNIEIVTVSGGSPGSTDPPLEEDLTILQIVNFEDIPNDLANTLTGEIQIQNNTTADLDLVNVTGGPTSPGIGVMEVATIDGKEAKYPLEYKVKVGDTQTIVINYIPADEKMPLGNYQYEFDLIYEY